MQCNQRPPLQATGDCQLHHNVPSHEESFHETANHPGGSAPLQPRFGTSQLLAFLKTKITFEREEISDYPWIQENMTGQLMAIPTKDFAECFEQCKRH